MKNLVIDADQDYCDGDGDDDDMEYVDPDTGENLFCCAGMERLFGVGLPTYIRVTFGNRPRKGSVALEFQCKDGVVWWGLASDPIPGYELYEALSQRMLDHYSAEYLTINRRLHVSVEARR